MRGTSASSDTSPSTSCLDNKASIDATSEGLIDPLTLPDSEGCASFTSNLPATCSATELRRGLESFVSAPDESILLCAVVTWLSPDVTWSPLLRTVSCFWTDLSSRDVIWGIVVDPSSCRMASVSEWCSWMCFNERRIMRRALCTCHVATLLCVCMCHRES